MKNLDSDFIRVSTLDKKGSWVLQEGVECKELGILYDNYIYYNMNQ